MSVRNELAYSSVPWVCVASGPSLSMEQIYCIKKVHERDQCRVLAVSDSYKLLPDADIVYSTACDWWDWHYIAVKKACRGRLVTPNAAAALKYKGLEYVEGVKVHQGLSSKRGTIHLGKNSGFAALNLAVLEGAKKVLLVGYDMRKHDEPKDKGKETYGLLHWFGDHPVKKGTPYFKGWIEKYRETVGQLKEWGIEVVNCTPESALRCYPSGSLEECLL